MFVVACFFVCLEFQIIRFVISTTFTPIFIEISFVLLPPPLPAENIKVFTDAQIPSYFLHINDRFGSYPSIRASLRTAAAAFQVSWVIGGIGGLSLFILFIRGVEGFFFFFFFK